MFTYRLQKEQLKHPQDKMTKLTKSAKVESVKLIILQKAPIQQKIKFFHKDLLAILAQAYRVQSNILELIRQKIDFMTITEIPFWTQKALTELTNDEWELLCDGCGKCCVLKLEDIETEAVYYTDVACKMLDCQTGRCRDYERRKQHVPDCILLTPKTIEQLAWMPKTCAYRLVYEGQNLPDWHPLISGSTDTVMKAGHSVAGQVLQEGSVEDEDMANHIRNWDDGVEH